MQPAAGDVGDAVDHVLDAIITQHLPDRADINPRRLQERLAHGAAEFLDAVADLQAGDVEDDLTGEAVAVGMQAGRGQAQNHVAGHDH